MISRSLVLLGIGVALVFGVPSISAAQTATTKTAAVEQVKPKPKAKAAANKPNKKNNKAVAKGKAKKPAKETEVTEDKPVGLFAALFKPNDKTKVAGKADSKATAKAAAKAKEKEKAQKEATRREILQPMKPIQAIQPVQPMLDAQQTAFRNDGELRSEKTMPRSGFFGVLFGDDQVMLPETRTLDAALAQKEARKKFTVRPEFEPQVVEFSGYPSGTIVIDTSNHFLYLVEGLGSARRYGIAVGKDGLQYKGEVKVGDKQEWPRWIPTKDMQEREPKKYGQYKDGMPGGGENPLGARAIYLYDGKKDTHLRIHGTIAPQTIGTNSSNGCFRMVNDHVIDLYRRVKVGTQVVVL